MAEIKYIPGTRKVQDITGETFGRLVVIRHIGVKGGQHWWFCQCSCGKTKEIAGNHLRSGRTRSCGCLHDEVRISNRKHGLSKTYLEKTRFHMIYRCYSPKSNSFKNYGGRGITVCKRWRESLLAFAEDMGPRPTPKHSIDRINNDGNYEPDNCRWATQRQQCRNTRVNTLLTLNGETRCLIAWSEKLGINASTLCARLYQYGWNVQRTLQTPVRRNARKST